MADDWATAPLAELCDFRAGSGFKPALQGRTSGEFPFVKVSDMNLPANAVRIQDANNWVSAADLKELKAKPFPTGTVVFAKIGEALRQNRLRQVARETIVDNNMMGAIPRVDRVDARYFYYALSKFDFSEIAQGTALPYLTVTALSALTMDVPPLDEQRAISHILGTLDDKIELNRQMNETFEAVARALFKSWFVDFDPVRAKAKGCTPALPKLLADLFPDSFEDSELGEIPKGWSVSPLRELTGYLGRGLSPAYVDVGGICVLNQKCVRNSSVDFSKARRHDSSKKSTDGRLLRVHDVLVNSTGVGTLGRIAQLFDLPEPAIVDSHMTVVRAATGIDPWFLGIALTGREAEVEALGEGSTGQTELSRARLGQLSCLVPPEALQATFGRIVEPFLMRLSGNERTSNTMAALRDTLLPKLITGNLRIEDPASFLRGSD